MKNSISKTIKCKLCEHDTATTIRIINQGAFAGTHFSDFVLVDRTVNTITGTIEIACGNCTVNGRHSVDIRLEEIK